MIYLFAPQISCENFTRRKKEKMISFYFPFYKRDILHVSLWRLLLWRMPFLILKHSKHLNIYIVWRVNIFVHSVKNSSQGVSSLVRGRVNNSLQPSLFSSHGCIYTKVAVSTSSMNLCLSCPVTWTVLHAWLHYGISIKTMHFDHCQ